MNAVNGYAKPWRAPSHEPYYSDVEGDYDTIVEPDDRWCEEASDLDDVLLDEDRQLRAWLA